MGMWRRFDAVEIAEDVARIAGLGLDAIRIFLRWDDFQPQPDALDRAMLEHLERVVGLAAGAGLQVVPVLFCGHASGVNFLPAWSLDSKRSHGRYRTIVGDSESPFGLGNPYTAPLLDAQLRFARAVGERLRGHAGIRAWDLGHAFSNVREPGSKRVSSGEHSTEPASEPEVADWSRRLTAALHESSAIEVTAGTQAADVTQDRSLRLSSLCAPFGFASMAGSTVSCAFARNRLDPEVVPFLATLAAAFSFKAVLVTGFGNPTCPRDKFSAFERFAGPSERPNLTISADDTAFATYPCLTEYENATYCTDVLERLHADGRLGAFWWCWADYADDEREPPFDEAPHERSFGIIRSDGTEKPVARALAAFAAEGRSVARSNDMPMISSTYYYRTLPTSTKTLYDAFLRFVSARRTGGPAR
jgi:hypothetical protein